MKNFTREEMISLWERRLGLAAPAGLTEYNDATGQRRALADEIDTWYARLLLEADPRLVNTENLASDALLEAAGDNCVAVTLPGRGVKWVDVRMPEWEHPLSFSVSPDSPQALLQLSPWLRATPERPLVVEMPGTLLLYGISPKAPGQPLRLSRLTMTCAPADGSFRLDQSLLKFD